MSGALVLAGAPSSGLHAATKTYTDSYMAGLAVNTSALSSISNNQVLGWNTATSSWSPLTVVGAADATAIQGTNVDSGAPTTAKVLVYDTAVASKWAAATLGAASLASDSVTTVKILDSNVTTAKLASSSVTAAVINSDAVTTTKILDANVTAAKLASGTLTSTQVSATAGIATYAVASKSATGAIAVSETVVLADSSGGAITLTLPAVAGVGSGQVYTIKKTDSGTNAVTIAPAAGTIDGSATIALYTQYESMQLVTNGANWFRLSDGLKTWKRIYTVTVGVATTSVTLPASGAFDGDVDQVYRFVFHMRAPDVGVGGYWFYLHPNGDTTSAHFSETNFYSHANAATGNGPNAYPGLNIGVTSLYGWVDAEVFLQAKTGAPRTTRANSFDVSTAGVADYSMISASAWNDQNSNNTNITYYTVSCSGAAGNCVGAGSTIDVFTLR